MTDLSPVFAGLATGLTPKPKISLSQWMEQEMRLSAESSAVPGPFRFGDAEYQRGIADAITDTRNEEVVIMSSSQVGKSTIQRGALGYYAERDPSPILAVLPTEKVARDFASNFVDPMIRDTPCLQNLFSSEDGRENTKLRKQFPGGTLSLVGSNVPSDLAMRPVRVVLGDETDRFAISSGKEGDPLTLARARTKTYSHNRRLIWTSTPVHAETSVISRLFEASDKRYFMVTCPHCDHEQPLEWGQVKYDVKEPQKAVYLCAGEGCGTVWSDIEKRRLVRKGRWVATAPFSGTAGFHLSELYSPWSSLGEIAARYVKAGNNPELLQAFWNTTLGLPWSGDMIANASADSLIERKEAVKNRRVTHPRVALVTCAVDVQQDRVEVGTVGWGPGNEQWILDHQRLYGDPTGTRVWHDLEEYLQRVYEHPSGQQLRIEGVAIDSSAFTQHVYDFADKHQSIGRPWYAIKGDDGVRPIWMRSKQKLKGGTKLYIVGIDDAKADLYIRIRNETVGPGYVHIPDWLSDEVIQQITAEYAATELNKQGFPVTKWHKRKGMRNEMLDLMVYNYAIERSLNYDLDQRLRRFAAKDVKPTDIAEIGRQFAAL